MKTNTHASFKQHSVRTIFFLFCLSLVTFSCKKKSDDEVAPENPTTTENNGGIGTTTVASNLDTPWQIVVTPDGRVLFTERRGLVKVIENGHLQTDPYLNLRDSIIEAGESGLTGIAVDPDFAQNHYLYLAYSYEKSKNPFVIQNKIVRYREDPNTKVPAFDTVLLDGIEGYINHNVGSLHFGPDGKLYIPVGERFIPEYAQDPAKLNGKILRIERDGSIPSDNPFPNSKVYTLGHRNPQGLAWQPTTNNLFDIEHGPSETQGCCMDEINLILPGKNYGWPLIRGSQHQAGLETSVYHSGDTVTWAPSQGVFVTTGAWNGSLLFTGLFDKALHRAIFDPNDPKKITKVETYLKGKLGRVRAIAKGADGKIYIGTSNGDGRGIATDPNDDRILTLQLP